MPMLPVAGELKPSTAKCVEGSVEGLVISQPDPFDVLNQPFALLCMGPPLPLAVPLISDRVADW